MTGTLVLSYHGQVRFGHCKGLKLFQSESGVMLSFCSLTYYYFLVQALGYIAPLDSWILSHAWHKQCRFASAKQNLTLSRPKDLSYQQSLCRFALYNVNTMYCLLLAKTEVL